MRELNSKLDFVSKERDQTVKQYETNEQLWKEKYLKKQHECSQVLALHEQLKEDNRDALKQIEKLVNRIKSLQEDNEALSKESRDKHEKASGFEDQTKQLSEANEQLKHKNSILDGAVKQLKDQVSELTEKYTLTKDTLKETELNCNRLYKELSDTNTGHVNKI